ncbi:alpha-amylase 1 isoform X2 [Cephus cinctus]|uniref:Alpha-amylase n=1 Tax=Cephus cinctus TaxID=211228 RepID=A0AAJ7C953_CEPCN|nr:alpha-amylase 1 isoform X2 [Cephus cinctus]
MCVSVLILALFGSVLGTHKDPHFSDNHGTIVHLFEWKWSDIADECERFLGPMGYGGIQTSPVQENVVIGSRPWWERYQPISYKWVTRSGDAEAFKDMVRRCNKDGVRIYVDAVINHMSTNQKLAVGTGGSTADTSAFQFYAVPYGPGDFNRGCSVTNYKNVSNVRNCELNGLRDLNQGKNYVREKIIDFMNGLIDVGVAGFRIDAAKHMWPNDLEIIYNKLHNLSTKHGFKSGQRPYIYQEVIDNGGEAVSSKEYNRNAAVTEFKHSNKLSNAFQGRDALKWLINWGEGWGFLPSGDALVFVDNHDNQRGHGSGGSILTHKKSKLYKMATAFMLAHPYGVTQVMSSFHFDNSDAGPPADSSGNIISPGINADGTCSNGWVCEHRWRQIYNMVRFRNVVKGTALNDWWDNKSNQIAFCRGGSGFIAVNGDSWDLKQTLQTCLPAGTYCDVISGNLVNGKCSGKSVTVGRDGKAYIEILKSEYDGVLAIHKQVKTKNQHSWKWYRLADWNLLPYVVPKLNAPSDVERTGKGGNQKRQGLENTTPRERKFLNLILFETTKENSASSAAFGKTLYSLWFLRLYR